MLLITFYIKGGLPIDVNCTTITLVPKLVNASHLGDFRPIACYSLLYEINYKILTLRLQQVISRVLNKDQVGFILGRQLGDNIFLAIELVKGYNRKFNSPKCMIKVNFRKA